MQHKYNSHETTLSSEVYDVPINTTKMGIIRRTDHSNLAGSHTISSYEHSGIIYRPQFPEGSAGRKKYGDRTYPVVVPAGDVEVRFDLGNEIQAMQFEFARNAANLKVFPFNEDAPLLEIYDPEKEFLDEQKQFSYADEAGDIYRKELTTTTKRRDFAILFNMHQGSDAMVETNIKRMIRDEPETFLRTWSNPSRELAVMCHKAIALNIIKRDHTGMYRYGESVMGKDVDDVVGFLRKEVSLAPLIRNEIQSYRKQ